VAGDLSERITARLDALKEAAGTRFDKEAVRQFAILAEVPPELAATVVAARSSVGPIMLGDLLAAEPKNLGHVGQSADDVLKMWEQLATDIAGRDHILKAAEAAGYFAGDLIKREEAQARRDALRVAFLDDYYAKRVTRDALIAKVDREIGSWAAQYAIAVERVRLSGRSRVEADSAVKAWMDGVAPPAAIVVESESMAVAWPSFTKDQKRLVLDQPWGRYLPAIRVGERFELLHLMAATPPEGRKTLRELAEPLLIDDVYRELIVNLTRGARITRK
jgi:hypothetical protein